MRPKTEVAIAVLALAVLIAAVVGAPKADSPKVEPHPPYAALPIVNPPVFMSADVYRFVDPQFHTVCYIWRNGTDSAAMTCVRI